MSISYNNIHSQSLKFHKPLEIIPSQLEQLISDTTLSLNRVYEELLLEHCASCHFIMRFHGTTMIVQLESYCSANSTVGRCLLVRI